jgi:hypothetical protein
MICINIEYERINKLINNIGLEKNIVFTFESK